MYFGVIRPGPMLELEVFQEIAFICYDMTSLSKVRRVIL